MAGFFTFVFLRITRLPESTKNVLIGVMIVGVGWEVLELLYKVNALSTRYWIDTVKDLIDDTIGGFISIYIWKKIPNQK